MVILAAFTTVLAFFGLSPEGDRMLGLLGSGVADAAAKVTGSAQ
jgi:hypothetical protein